MRRGNRGPNTVPDGTWLEVNDCIRELVRDLPEPAVVVDLDGHAWIWNAAAELLFPPPPQTGSATRYPLFSAGAQPWFAKAREAVRLGRRSAAFEWGIRGLGGARYKLGVSITPLHGDDGAVNALLALLHDTTAQEPELIREHQTQRSGAPPSSGSLSRLLLGGEPGGERRHHASADCRRSMRL